MPKSKATKRRKYPCAVVKKSEWDKMPKKTRAAMIEMCQTAADQVGSVQRRKLAKAIAYMLLGCPFLNNYSVQTYRKIRQRIERLLKKHGI